MAADNPSAVPGTITFGGGALQFTINNPNSPIDYSGNILNSTSAITIDSNGQQIFFGTSLDSSNVAGLTKIGAGTLYLTVGNAYSGPTTISSGTLNVGDPGAIPSGSTITFAGGTLQFSNSVDYSSSPYGIVNSSGPIAIDTNGQNVTFAGSLGNSNSGGLTKIGGGTLVLGANNSYGGATTVTGGSLQMGAA